MANTVQNSPFEPDQSEHLAIFTDENVRKSLYLFCRSLTKNDADAEDLLQSTFVRVGEGGFGVDRKINAGYLVVTARNIFYNQQRRNRKVTFRPILASDEIIDYLDGESSSTTVHRSKIEEYQRHLARARLRNYLLEFKNYLRPILKKLTKEERMILRKRWIEDLSYDEIACDLGLPRDLICEQAQRAKKKIQYQVRLVKKKIAAQLHKSVQ